MSGARFSGPELAFLLLNVFTLGGLVVLMILTGPSVPGVLLAVGAAGMVVGKLGRSLSDHGRHR